jgi:hypothetical protein
MTNIIGNGQIIDIMNKRLLNQNQIINLEENIYNIELTLDNIKLDTDKLSSLKDKLMFIEQCYINKTSIESDINCKIGRIEQNCESFKRNIENLCKDIKFIKDQVKILTNNKDKKNILSLLFKKDFLFTSKR